MTLTCDKKPMSNPTYFVRMLALLLALLLSTSCAHNDTEQDSQGETAENSQDEASGSGDRWERFNRWMHNFNEVADRVMLKPTARVYKAVMPPPLYRGLGNAKDNLGDIKDGVNNILQGKIKQGAGDFLRVLINTTLGLGGLFDLASKMGLPDHQEDFGQTLARWGVPPGPYLVLPFLGPTTLRDAVSYPFDTPLDPVRYLSPVDHRNIIYGQRLIHARSQFLAAEDILFGDKYIFFKNAYLQRREFLVNDGEVEDPFDDEF